MLPWYIYPATCCVLFGGGCGWVLGYMHRDFIEWGRRLGRLAGWWTRYRWRPLRAVARVYAGLWRDVVHLAATGELRPGR